MSKISLFLVALMLPVLMSAQVSVNITGTSPTCNGYTNGSVTATASGGTGPYSYIWNNGVGGNTLQSIGAGNYSVAVTDANGNAANASFNLTQPTAVNVTVSAGNPCTGGGNATAIATGGTGGYSYLWDNGATGASVSGLSAGLHCVTVTDANGCQDVGCAVITSVMAVTMNVQGLACFNFCDASVEAIVTGGTAPYTYLWSNGATGSVNPNLGPGTYSVTVTDVNGCTVTGTAAVGNPANININVSVTNPSCTGGGTGSATANASGGTPPYSYLWNTGSMQQTITGLFPGTYTVTVTDFLGCASTAAAVVIPAGSVFLNIAATPSSSCGITNGTASVTVTGGTAPYTYLWNTGATTTSISGLAPGNYSVVVTDAAGCGATAQVTVGGTPAIDLHISGVSAGCAANGSANAMVTPGTGTPPFSFLWNTGATTPIINNLTPGTYSVTVTDAAGCTDTDQVTVTGSSNISVSASAASTTCFGSSNGSATAVASGAVGTVTYQWSNGGTTQTIGGLSAGTYFVTVTDQATSCTANTSAFVSQPTQVTASVTSVNGICNTLGSASVVASGGTPPYTYAWSNGGTGTSISNLVSGAYAVTATDSHGCVAMGMVLISNTTTSLNVTVTVTHPISAVNATDGAVAATVSNGTAPYTYLWNTGATTSSLSNLGEGTYTVTVTDVNGCTGTDSETLYEPSCIGDRVWMDMDRDGCQDPGPAEFGFPNVTVTLTGTTVTGVSVNQTTTTANNGFYIFNNLQPGTYQVQFGLPSGFAFSPANACIDDFSDSDANASGNTGNITLASGNCKVTVDAGIYDDCLNVTSPGTICCDQVLCGPGNDAAPITSVTPATGGGSPTVYMWMYSTIPGPYNPNTWLPVPSGGMSATYDPGLIYETTFFIRCAKAQDCDDWKESNIVAVEVGEDAVADIQGLDLVCVGDQVLYTAANSSPGSSYSWNFGPWATPSTSNAQSVLVTWNQAGVVYVTLSVTNNDCTSTDVLGVAISNSPIICGNAIVINVNNQGSAVMVEWEAEKVTGDYEFGIQRSDDGVHFTNMAVMPQAQEPGMHQYNFADYFPKRGNAFYRLEVLHIGQHLMYSNLERIQRFSPAQRFIAHPNPVSDLMTIETSDVVETIVQIEVLNLQGKLVEVLKLGAGTTNQAVDFSHLQAGAYLLRFRYNNGERDVIKFVKE
ncbi:MAG: T9SS type A sorting domain-containing protein [Bacteroidetes bacterium]|nr:T9SS type A sorting domain-containing protein [Bacteroidota bacterium]